MKRSRLPVASAPGSLRSPPMRSPLEKLPTVSPDSCIIAQPSILSTGLNERQRISDLVGLWKHFPAWPITGARSGTYPIHPPAVPLAVPGPYVSSWLPGTEPLAAVKRRAHEALLAALGPTLYEGQLDQRDLEVQVTQTLQTVLQQDETPLTGTLPASVCGDVHRRRAAGLAGRGRRRSTGALRHRVTLRVLSGRWMQPRLPMSRPRPGWQTISPVGVTRFWSGTTGVAQRPQVRRHSATSVAHPHAVW
jgi:hypothetical protein